jgi:hypothetical protein
VIFLNIEKTDLPNFPAVMIFSIILLKIVNMLTTPCYQED